MPYRDFCQQKQQKTKEGQKTKLWNLETNENRPMPTHTSTSSDEYSRVGLPRTPTSSSSSYFAKGLSHVLLMKPLKDSCVVNLCWQCSVLKFSLLCSEKIQAASAWALYSSAYDSTESGNFCRKLPMEWPYLFVMLSLAECLQLRDVRQKHQQAKKHLLTGHGFLGNRQRRQLLLNQHKQSVSVR